MKQILITICFLPAIGLAGEEVTAREAMAKSWQLYRAVKNEKEEVRVIVSYNDGRKSRIKYFTRWIKYDTGGRDKVMIRFTAPARDDGLGLLIWRQLVQDDNVWLKMPSRKRPRRISMSRQGRYFAGTDVTYEDSRQLVGERMSDFIYAWQNQVERVIKVTPKAKTKSSYSYRIFYFNDRQAVVKVEYYHGGYLIKTQTNNRFVYEQSGCWRANQTVFDNKLLGRRTEISVIRRQFNVDWPVNPFTKSFLTSQE